MSRDLCDYTRTAFAVLPWVYPFMKDRTLDRFTHFYDIKENGFAWVPRRCEGKWAAPGEKFFDYKVVCIYEASEVYSLSLFMKREADLICLTGWHARRTADRRRLGATIEELMGLSEHWGRVPPVLNLNPEFND